MVPSLLTTIDLDDKLSHRRFEEHSPRLFGSNQDDFEVLQRRNTQEATSFDSFLVTRPQDLEPMIKNDTVATYEKFCIFHKRHSWDRFCVSQTTINRVLTQINTFPPVKELFCAFGLKTREDDNSFNYFQQRATTGTSSIELCYCFRYVERNERGTGDPWSLRQTGVYQKIDTSAQSSTWILLQPSQTLREQLRKTLGHFSECNDRDVDPLLYHVLIMASSVRNWNEYIMDLYRDVDDMNDKACFSRVGFKKKYDFSLAFSDCQKLRLTEKKILLAASALDSYIDTCNRCMAFCKLRTVLGNHLSECAICIDIASCLAEAELYRRKTGHLLQHCSSTMTLLLKILEYRNDEVIQESNVAQRTTLEVMKDVSLSTQKENEGLGRLAAQTAKDSKTLKALTLIATIYLPATFLATIFSSNLVERKPDNGEDASPTHFALANDFWKYVIIIIPLMAFTLALTALLEWMWSKRSMRDRHLSLV